MLRGSLKAYASSEHAQQNAEHGGSGSSCPRVSGPQRPWSPKGEARTVIGSGAGEETGCARALQRARAGSHLQGGLEQVADTAVCRDRRRRGRQRPFSSEGPISSRHESWHERRLPAAWPLPAQKKIHLDQVQVGNRRFHRDPSTTLVRLSARPAAPAWRPSGWSPRR